MFKKRHPEIGSRPGTLVIAEESPPPRISMIRYAHDLFSEKKAVDVEDLKGALEDDSIAWVDVQGFGDQETIERVGELFHLHPLLLEDIVNVPQRPKSESYDDQLLVVVRMPAQTDGTHPGWDFEQVCIVIGPHYVLTFQEQYGDVFDPVRERIRQRTGRIYERGADYLGYALIDTVVDAIFPMLETIGDALETLEDEVMLARSPDLLPRLTRWRSQLSNMRRILWPHRDAVNALVRGDHPIISESVQVYLRDTYDHAMQSSEVAEMYREMVSNLMNTYLTAVANRTNEVMRVLTIVSTIFIPMTFIAGVYGMNFANMPELQSRWGYPAAWFAMLTVAGGLTAYFYHKGWLFKGDK